MSDDVRNIVEAVNKRVEYRGQLVAEFVEKLEEVDNELKALRETFAKLGNLPGVREILQLEPVKKARAPWGSKTRRKRNGGDEEAAARNEELQRFADEVLGERNPDSNSAA